MSAPRMLGLSAGLALVALSTGSSCAPDAPRRPQWLVTLRTDAPVPLIGDRLLVEVRGPDGELACPACRRVIDASTRAAWPVSFGIEPAETPLTVQARLYRARAVDADGTPSAAAAIDARVTLSGAPERVTIPLVMRCFGVGSTGDASCAATAGELAPLAPAERGSGDAALVPGSWELTHAAPCQGPTPEGMVCVDGGAFFLVDGELVADAAQRLVFVSSFFLDADEMSVRRARAIIAAGKVTSKPFLRGTSVTGGDVYCTYLGPDDVSNDDAALNCVSEQLAREMCRAEGKRLVTEAEFAFAAGNGALASVYPWGDDEDVCAHAVVERDDGLNGGGSACRVRPGQRTAPPGPVKLTAAAPDVTLVPPGIRNLGGNLSEWTADHYTPLDDARCWPAARPALVDPRCKADPSILSVRGGSWVFLAFSARSTFRTYEETGNGTMQSNRIGFRCARDATPR